MHVDWVAVGSIATVVAAAREAAIKGITVQNRIGYSLDDTERLVYNQGVQPKPGPGVMP